MQLRTVRLSGNACRFGDLCFLSTPVTEAQFPKTFGQKLDELGVGQKGNCFVALSDTKEIRYRDIEHRNIKFAVIPRSVRELCSFAFERCMRLRFLVFEDESTLERIGNYCFLRSGLERITIPSATTDIAPSAFQNCLQLKEIGQIRGQEIVKFALGRDGIYEFPPETTLVGGISLYDLREMSEVFLPEGLTSVGRHWFAGSRVTKVHIPASVAELDDYAFAWCAQLSEVVF